MIGLLLGLLGCGDATDATVDSGTSTDEPAAPITEHDPLPAPALLRRISLDLRGTLPPIEALDAVEADPDQIAVYRDAWLDDPALEERLVAMFAELWHTRIDLFLARHYDYGLGDELEFDFERAAGEEPLRLMAYVAVNDRPWGEIVTADYAMADALLAEIWPLEITGDERASGWRVAEWTDGRPGAGVLSSNGLWWRYYTTQSNMNRARAAALSRLLLCEDFLARPVSFSDTPSVLDEAATAEAIRSDPGCLACHAALEPIAATLFGFWWDPPESATEITSYHAEREHLGPQVLGVEPAFFGQPVSGLEGLGEALQSDGRFAWCAAETAASMLWRRPPGLDDFDRVASLRDGFATHGTFRPLLAAVTDTDVYRADDDGDESALTRRMLSPDQLASSVEDLTGFRWVDSGFDQLHNDERGYRVLAGGLDGAEVLRQQQDPGLSWAVVVERLAQSAAVAAVERDLVDGSAPELLTDVTLDSAPGDDAFTAQLQALHWRLYAERADAEWLALAEGLWSDLDALEGPETAWRGLLSAMLRDPLFVSY